MSHWWPTGCKVYLSYFFFGELVHGCMMLRCLLYLGGLLMQQNWPLETWHAIMSLLSGNEIYCPSNLMARFSSWMVYWNDFWSVGWTSGILWILKRWNCSDLSMRGMCRTAYKVSDIMMDQNLMNLYMYQIFSLCHAGRVNLGCEINLVSSLISKDMRSRKFNRAGVNSVNLWLKFDLLLIEGLFQENLFHCGELLGGSLIETWWWKSFYHKLVLKVPSRGDGQWCFTWTISFCNELNSNLLVFVSA